MRWSEIKCSWLIYVKIPFERAKWNPNIFCFCRSSFRVKSSPKIRKCLQCTQIERSESTHIFFSLGRHLFIRRSVMSAFCRIISVSEQIRTHTVANADRRNALVIKMKNEAEWERNKWLHILSHLAFGESVANVRSQPNHLLSIDLFRFKVSSACIRIRLRFSPFSMCSLSARSTFRHTHAHTHTNTNTHTYSLAQY